MNTAFELLMLVSLVGAVDVLWFHLFKWKLPMRPASRLEETTHLARHLLFAAITAALVLRAPRAVVLALLVVDLLNSLVDLFIEPRSRADLGGVSGGEALLHGLAGFMLGGVTALVAFGEQTWQPTPMQFGRGLVTAGLALVLFGLELRLTAKRAPQTLGATS